MEISREDLVLGIGLLGLLFLIKTEGIQWVKKFFLLFFVSTTLLEWIKKKIEKWKKGELFSSQPS